MNDAAGLASERGIYSASVPGCFGASSSCQPPGQVEGRSGTLVQTAPFSLTVKAPLPPGQLSTDVAQAAGGRQQAGQVVNQVVVLDPLRATGAANASGTVQIRHGFLPSGTPIKP